MGPAPTAANTAADGFYELRTVVIRGGSIMESASIAIAQPQLSIHLHLPRGRFSIGIEKYPDSPSKLRVGRFSQGIEQQADTPAKLAVGRFSTGIEQRPDVPGAQRVGSFADGYELIGRA
jgi:hypothetical protein